MSWYKIAQFVDYNALVNGILQRIRQAESGGSADANAYDDIHSQGFDFSQINNAIQQALNLYLGGAGTEFDLNDAQRHLLATLRGQDAQMPDMGVQQDSQLKSV